MQATLVVRQQPCQVILIPTQVGDVSNLKNRLAGHKYLAQIARYTGLDVCVKTSERQRTASLPDGTLKAATVAVIGAVWRDSNRNFDETLAAIRNLG